MQIYLIRHRDSGQSYVGQTIWDFNTRYRAGNWVGTTTSQHLRAAGKKYGKEAFDVSILWEGQCSRDELDRLEDQFMKKHNSLHPSGYNLKEAGRTGKHLRMCREYELIDALGTIYHVVNLSQFCKRMGFSYGAMLNMVSGLTDSSHGLALSSTPIENITDPKETWELEHVGTGERKTVVRESATDTAISMGIKSSTFWLILSGKCLVSGGWKLSSTVLDAKRLATEKRRYQGVDLIHENGETVRITNVVEFCKARGIDRAPIYDVISGESLFCQGWRLPSTNIKQEWTRRCGMEVDLFNWQTNETVHVKNVSEWCRQRHIDLATMHTMIYGSIQQYMGWTVSGRDLSNYSPPKKLISIIMRHEDGREISGKNAKDLIRTNPVCCSQIIGAMISGKSPNRVKGWKVVHVKFLNNYYPEMVWDEAKQSLVARVVSG